MDSFREAVRNAKNATLNATLFQRRQGLPRNGLFPGTDRYEGGPATVLRLHTGFHIRLINASCRYRALNAGIDRPQRLAASPRPLGVSSQAALEPAPIGRLRAGAPAALSVKYLKNRHGVAPPCRTPCTVCGGAPCDAFSCDAFLSIQLNDIPRGSLQAGLRPALPHRRRLPIQMPIQIPVRICRDKARQRTAAERRRSPVAATGRKPASFGRFRPGSAGTRVNRAFAGRHPGNPYSTRVSGLPVGRSPFYAGWR